MNSISRKLKELVLATVAPGDNISDYDVIVTGYSLGGALATLFIADIGEYGIDAGRGLPQVEESEPWWNSLASTFFNNKDNTNNKPKDTKPPKPKSLKQALSHHMEDQYYSAMGCACGFVALVGDQIRSLDENDFVMDIVTSITSNDDDDRSQ